MPLPTTSDSRPIYLDLRRIRLPLPALLSITHRLSGLLLALSLPPLLFVFERSLSSAEGFDAVIEGIRQPPFAALLLLPAWALLHHLFAGIRYLLIDLHIGVDLAAARRSSIVVIIVELLLLAPLAWVLLS